MTAEPTSRERVLTALSHREPDRVPIDLGGTESSGMHADAYAALSEHLGIEETLRIFDLVQQVVLVGDQIRDRFSIDTAPMAYQPAEWKEDTTPQGRRALVPAGWRAESEDDGSHVVRDEAGRTLLSMPSGGLYFDERFHPLADVSDPSELDRYDHLFENFDKPIFMDEGWDAMARRARELHEGTGLCVVANFCVHLLAAGQSLRGFENFMMDLVATPDLACALMEKLLEAYLPRVDTFAEKIAPWVDVVLVNDDLGTQNGPQISPETYRRTVKPYQRRLFGYIKEKTGKPLLLHSCGSVRRLIGDLVELGVDALNPVQVSAAGMETAELKADFGDDITFWGGGCDTQHVLSRATPEKVRDEVRRRFDDLAPGGGFVFTQVHNVQPDVPPENVVAMLEAAREFAPY